MHELFTEELRIVNVGLSGFAENIVSAGGHAVQLAWRPPAGGNVDTGLTLARMINDPRVENANRTAFARYLDAQRLSPFTRRSLDIDVVLDLMVHDLHLAQALNPGSALTEVRAVGVPVGGREPA